MRHEPPIDESHIDYDGNVISCKTYQDYDDEWDGKCPDCGEAV